MSEVICRLKQTIGEVARLKPPAVDPTELSYAAITYLAADEDRVGRFLAVTGLTPDAIRVGLGKPYFTTGVLDYIASRDELVLGLAEAAGLRPEAVYRAREAVTSIG